MQSQFGRDCRRLTDMVRLNRPCGYQRIRPFSQRVGHQKLQLAQFIAAHCNGRNVIALNVNLTAKIIRQSRQVFERGRRADKLQAREAR